MTTSLMWRTQCPTTALLCCFSIKPFGMGSNTIIAAIHSARLKVWAIYHLIRTLLGNVSPNFTLELVQEWLSFDPWNLSWDFHARDGVSFLWICHTTLRRWSRPSIHPLRNPGLHESCFGEILLSGIRGAVQPSRRILDVDDDNYIDVGRPAWYL